MAAAAEERLDAEEVPGLLSRTIEAQRGRAFLWSPVALALGIWTYFGLAREPGVGVTVVLAGAACCLWALGRRRGLILLTSLAILGFALAKFRAESVGTPLIRTTTGEVSLAGVVQDVSVSGKRRILIVAPSAIEGFAPSSIPRRLRLVATSKQGEARIGDHVSTHARLAPLPTPVLPGGFDYGRQLYFEGIGGTGRITQPLTISPGSERLSGLLEDIRRVINARIRATLRGNTAAFAEALIDGERGTIPKDLNRSFQISGLAHVLSISGLHMSLVAGGVFWLVRAALALVPALALRFPIKKWAAGAALAAGLFYMLLAGSEVATQRSYIMIAVVFFAVLVDRPALSLRNLAVAALIILITQPEAAVQASFQMSFLAVLGLAAFFEAWAGVGKRTTVERREAQPLWQRTVAKLAVTVGISLATTLVAGAMSSIPAAFHFGRVAPYGILGNGLAIPVISLVVMPMALLAAILMPFGLETWPLWLMGQGLDLTITISDWVASLPGAVRVVPQPAPAVAMAAALGTVLFCLLAGPVRWIGITGTAAVLLVGWHTNFPDIVVNRVASNAAIRDAESAIVPLPLRRDRFSVEKWLLANGEATMPADAAKRTGWTCTPARCTTIVKGKSVAVLFELPSTKPDCRRTDIVIAGFPLRGACALTPIRIDRFDLWKNGPYAISIRGPEALITTARGLQGERPWTVVPKPRSIPFGQRPLDTSTPAANRGKSGSS